LGITRKQSSKWQAAATLPAAEFEKYISTTKEPTTAGVLKLVRERQRETGGPRSGGHILTAPASTLWQRLDDASVDLFLTDPPYSEIDLYRELAKLAAVKLKPGGLCLAHAGIGYLPAVLEAMGAHLRYHWTCAIKFAGAHSVLYHLRIKNMWQPVVVFSRGKSTAGWLTDHLRGGGREKDAHDYQKTLTDVEYLIDNLTVPGALVVDPYCGSGTVPAACKKLGRQWLACEVDSETARTARRRVAA
jgi:site-specific DNA-methyltransferase (adenine-specific)